MRNTGAARDNCNTMTIRLLLFDIDGTLIRTGAGRVALEQAMATVFGIQGALEGIRMAGNTDLEIVSRALARHGMSVPSDLTYLWSVNGKALRHVLGQGYPLEVLPGVESLLEGASATPGVHLGLVTGNARTTARIKLEQVGLWQRFSVGGFGDEHPDRADLIRLAWTRAVERWGPVLQGAGVVLIGDTPRDLRAARRAGVRAVGVASGFCSRKELASHAPDLLLPDLAVPDGLEQILALADQE